LVENALGERKAALAREKEAQAIWEELLDREGQARTLGYLGSIHYGASDFDAALDFFQKSLIEWERVQDQLAKSGTLGFIGDTFFRKKQFAPALESYQKSLGFAEGLFHREAMAALQAGIANVQLSLEQYEAARQSADKSISLAAETGNREVLWYAKFKLGQSLRQLKEPAKAQQSLEDSIRIIQELRGEAAGGPPQNRFLEGKTAPFLTLFEWMTSEGRDREALFFAEGAKLIELDEILGDHARFAVKGLSAEERAQDQRLRSQVIVARNRLARLRQSSPENAASINQWTGNLEKCQAAYQEFEKQLFARHPDLALYRLKFDPLSFNQLQTRLPAGDRLLLQYLVTENGVYRISLFPGKSLSSAGTASSAPVKTDSSWQVRVNKLELSAKALGAAVLEFREMLRRNRPDYAGLAQTLYSALLTPGWAEGKTFQHIQIVPDSVLWLCPFQALLNSANRFLIEEASIAYSSSLTILVLQSELEKRQKLEKRRPQGVRFSSPLPDPESQDRYDLMVEEEPTNLEKDQEESAISDEAISLSIPGVREYRGVETLKGSIPDLASSSAVADLAVPSVLDDYNPLFSPILFSAPKEGKPEDATLELREILHQDWNSRLVLLEGNQRPLKRLKAGEGLVAWNWALFTAKSPASIIREWPTGGESQSRLITGLLRAICAPTPQTARCRGSNCLRQEILKRVQSPEFRHPWNWAGYCWLGSGD
jgi:CHAT domain-containing protein